MTPLKSLALRLFTALLLGAASVAAFAPIGAFPVILLTLAGLFALLDAAAQKKASTREGALIGGAFGLGLFLTGVSWVFVSLSTFGGMPTPLAALATFLFCTVLSTFPALTGALYVRYARGSWWQRSLLFAATWTLGEWLRGWVLTGFPWLAVGYSQTPPSPLAGFAPLLGVYGISLITAFAAAPLWTSFVRFRQGSPCSGGGWKCPAQPLLVLLLVFAVGINLRQVAWTTPVGTPLTVSLLQGNIAQELKWRPELFNDSLRTYYHLALDNPAQLTILPETAIPAFIDQLPGGYLAELKRLAERENGNLFMGIAIGSNREYANSALSIGAAGEQRYNKVHLVPFGEYVPPGFKWIMRMVNIPMSDFTPGADRQTPISVDGQKIAVNICYEDAFGEEIIRALPEATVLANLSNVAWFGDSLAPAQHLQISRMRAMETGRMMLRSTNTGMTAIIGTDGRVISALPSFTRGALRGEVQGHEGLTPYARWGNWPTIVMAFSLLALFFRRKAVS
ncbi:MAG: apolipoprotein N-acyltransferase [Betaproteobacteria bacterium]